MQQVGKYQLIRKLATGGMAEVYLAKAAGPRGFEKTLVLKRILPHLAEEAAFVEMFLSEAMLAARLTHPHIVQIFDFGEADGAYFLAMEYIDGPSLRTLVKRAAAQQLPLPTTLCARIIAQACEGLAFAHDFTHPDTNKPLGLIHRDISPDNILLSRQGSAKVVDFGIAKAADQGHRTASGVIKGKIAYMPPEQLRAQELDRRVDVYALGVVLYELLTFHKPFESSSEVGLMQAILFESAVPATKHRPDLPEPLRAILTRALAKERAQRYPDCHALQADLEEFILTVGKPVTTQQVAQLIHHVSSSIDLPAVSPGVTVPLGPQMSGTPTHTPMPSPLMLGEGADTADAAPTMQAPVATTKVEEFRPTPLEASLLAAMKTPVREHIPPGTRFNVAPRAPEPAPLAPEAPTTQVRSPHASAKPAPVPPAPVPPAPVRAVPARPVAVRNAAIPARAGRGWAVAVSVAVLFLLGGGAVLWKTGTPPEPPPPTPAPPLQRAASAEPSVAPPVDATPPPRSEAIAEAPAPESPAPEARPAPAETAAATPEPATPEPATPEPTSAEPSVAEKPPVEEPSDPVVQEKTSPAPKAGQTEPKRAVTQSKSAAKGTLDLRVRPYATVYVDGKKLGDTPIAPPSLSAGRHVVRLVNEEHGEKKYEVSIEPNKPYVLKVNFFE